jgi:hypothetical protein
MKSNEFRRKVAAPALLCCASNENLGGILLRKASWLITTAAIITRAHAAPGAGANELQAAGGFFHTENSDSGGLNADLNYGYNLTPGWQVGIRQALKNNFIDDERDFLIASTHRSSITISALPVSWFHI